MMNIKHQCITGDTPEPVCSLKKYMQFQCIKLHGVQGEPPRGAAIIEIEIEIAIEIRTLPEIDFDHDFDTDPECPWFENKIALDENRSAISYTFEIIFEKWNCLEPTSLPGGCARYAGAVRERRAWRDCHGCKEQHIF